MVKLAINVGRDVMGLCVLGKTCLLDELLSRNVMKTLIIGFRG